IAVDGGAQEAEFAQLVHDLAVELLMPVGFQHPGHELVLGVVARGVAHHALLFRELILEQERVFPMEIGLLVRFGVHDVASLFRCAGSWSPVAQWSRIRGAYSMPLLVEAVAGNHSPMSGTDNYIIEFTQIGG